jgi:hypothetical protein
VSEDKKASILRKVRALMAKAEGTDHPEEADAFRQKADELMTAYAILEWELEQGDNGQATMPERKYYDFDWWTDRNLQEVVRDNLWYMLNDVASFARCKAIGMKLKRTDDDLSRLEIPILGLPSDFNYMDMLFTSLMTDMLGHLEPRPDTSLPMIENLVRMKEAGMKWERIGYYLFQAGQLDTPYTRNTGVRFTKLYTDYCRDNNRERVYTSPQVWQRSYAEGYSLEIGRRLREMKERRNATTETNTDANKYALVVKSTEQKIQDLWRELYPDMFTAPKVGKKGGVTKYRNYKYSAQATEAGRRSGQAARIVQPGEKISSNRRSLES